MHIKGMYSLSISAKLTAILRRERGTEIRVERIEKVKYNKDRREENGQKRKNKEGNSFKEILLREEQRYEKRE